MTQRTRLLGAIVALAAGLTLMAGVADAIPANAPKVGMVCTPGTVSGTTHTFNLVANTGYIETPDGNSVFMWSYANGDAPDSGHFQYPGPVLCVKQGETVVVNLTNMLTPPAATSIVFPGQEGVSATGGSAGLLTTEAAASGGTVTYTFTAGHPGTYLYESGSDISKQVEMGLVGALVVRPTLDNDLVANPNGYKYAYNDTATRYDPSREYLLLLSDIDPELHHAVETPGGTYDFTTLLNRYFTISGRAFPDTIQDNGSRLVPNQPYGSLIRIAPTVPGEPPALIRMLNAGVLNHPFHPHGNHTTEIAQDGRLVASTEHFGETIGSGQTIDYLIRWDDQVNGDNWDPTTNKLPVAQPNYRELTFKDSLTWYAGSPYLGYKGTLPTGTTSLNVCGEWYFPLHSHALNEFSNFDEGFGGMGTLLRVDPRGGCFTFPTATKITTTAPPPPPSILIGTLNGGSVANLAVQDGTPSDTTIQGQGSHYYRVNSTTTGTNRTNAWYGQFTGVPAGATNFSVRYVGDNCGTLGATPCSAAGLATGTTTTFWIWNWTLNGGLGAWMALTPIPLTTRAVDFTSVNLPAPAAYIGTGANRGLVRVLVQTNRTDTTNFVTRGDLMKLTYNAP